MMILKQFFANICPKKTKNSHELKKQEREKAHYDAK